MFFPSAFSPSFPCTLLFLHYHHLSILPIQASRVPLILATSPLDNPVSDTNSTSTLMVSLMCSDPHCSPSSSSEPGHTSALIPYLPHPATPSITIQSPQLADAEISLLKSTCLFGEVLGDPIPISSVINRLHREWTSIHGEVSIRYLSNGWFLIRFNNPLDQQNV